MSELAEGPETNVTGTARSATAEAIAATPSGTWPTTCSAPTTQMW